MGHPKYHTEPDLSQRSSHTLMVEQVGFDKRVLDVGCAGGYMGGVLVERGCRVVGIELDPDEAAEAKKVLDDVVVGDIEEMDLVAAFGEADFDVVVFGDVLEHLRDPARSLRQTRSLLRPGGYVVASIPNVAHGAVRLALLRGDFTYSETGLLDETHLRWFTRASLESLFRDTGFVITDLERTLLGLFDTEIVLERESFPPELIAEVERAEEALTYQFVVRAVPDDVTASIRRLADREAAQREEIFALRAELEDYRRLLWPEAPPACRVGVLGAFDPGRIGSVLNVPVLVTELQRRVAGLDVRVLTTRESAAPILDTFDPAELLGSLTPPRVRQLAGSLDVAIVVDEEAAGVADTREVGEGLLVLRAGDAQSTPDVLPLVLLLPRIFDNATLLAHLEILRAEGRFPRERLVVALVGSRALIPAVDEIVAALTSIEKERGDIALVSIEADAESAEFATAVQRAREGRVYSLRAEQALDVLAALVASSVVIAAGAEPLVAAAVGYGRPAVVAGWTTPDAEAFARGCGGIPVVPTPADVADVMTRALDGSTPRPDLDTIVLRLDDHLDGLAAAVRAEAERRASPLPPRSAAELGEYFGRLREAYTALAQRVADDRSRLGRRIMTLGSAARDAERKAVERAVAAIEREHAGTRGAFDQANLELAHLQLELISRRGEPDVTSVPVEITTDTRRVRLRSTAQGFPGWAQRFAGRARRLAGRARRAAGRFRQRQS